MNNPKIIALAKEQADKLLERNKKMGKTMPKILYRNNVNEIFLKFLGRRPNNTELETSINFIEKDNNNLAHLTQILICTGEFRNVK